MPTYLKCESINYKDICTYNFWSKVQFKMILYVQEVVT